MTLDYFASSLRMPRVVEVEARDAREAEEEEGKERGGSSCLRRAAKRFSPLVPSFKFDPSVVDTYKLDSQSSL